MLKTEEHGAITAQELKMISGSEGPCISILQPVHPLTSASTQKPIRLKKAIESVEGILTQRRMDPSQRRDLLEPLYEFEAGQSSDEQQGSSFVQGVGFVLFRSRRVFRYFYVSSPVTEFVSVADHFYILPLLPIAGAEKTFYILALSQKHIRLWRCTKDSIEEAPLPQAVPRTLEEAMQ